MTNTNASTTDTSSTKVLAPALDSSCYVAEPSWFDKLKYKVKGFFHREDVKKTNLYQHAMIELKIAGYFDPEDGSDCLSGMNKMMADNVLELIEVFAKQGHSGFSSQFCISLFETLARYKPLIPITGRDEEWTDVSEISGKTLYQNKRCSHVFKEGNGQAYDIDGKVFREPSGATYTSKDSRVYITFPYTPKTEYVDVPASEEETV